MYKYIALLLITLTFRFAFGEPQVSTTTFLNSTEPTKMCQDYIDKEYGALSRAMLKPTGGALIRVNMLTSTYCKFIFCDEPANRLYIFHLLDTSPVRTPVRMSTYGLQKDPVWFSITHEDSLIPDTITAPSMDRDSIGYFWSPVDIAVSSCGNTYYTNHDYIYVVDSGNRRIVKLRYDIMTDSILWIGSFGDDILIDPTAIDYADYNDADTTNDDVYVTDGYHAKIFRFSATGEYETSYGGRGTSLAEIGYPTGIAVSTDTQLPDRIYITDSKYHRVIRYYSGTSGPIVAQKQYKFPHYLPGDNKVPYLSAIDTDGAGNVYVLDRFAHKMYILSGDIESRIKEYGEYGFGLMQFNHPSDIYIDHTPVNEEMVVCEMWDTTSGIQSFDISYSIFKETDEIPLPKKYSLYQNYPNPFNSVTQIKFDLPRPSNVKLEIFNILGQKVKTIKNDVMPAGSHAIVWKGENDAGDEISSGMYFYKLSTSDYTESRKMLLLK